MTITHCGQTGNLKVDKLVRINHREMKLVLHEASSRSSRFRVYLTAQQTLHVSERSHGSAWTAAANSMPMAMRTVITEFLIFRNDHGTYYLEEREIASLMARLLPKA